MMAKVGHLTLVRSVLATMPLHQVVVLGLNTSGPRRRLIKILKGFFWSQGGHYHVNWHRECRPLRLGGLGVTKP